MSDIVTNYNILEELSSEYANEIDPGLDVGKLATEIALQFESDFASDELEFESITINRAGAGGGSSTKAVNIILDWRKLMVEGSEIVLAVAGVAAKPWLIPLVGIVIWKKVYSLSTVRISERHAFVLWVVWKYHYSTKIFSWDGLTENLAQEIKVSDQPELSDIELRSILTNLEEMRCLKRSDHNLWVLCETIEVGKT